MAAPTARKNSAQKTGPKRDAKGRLSGGNPGNSGGKPGRSGRKPLAWKALCEDILSDPDTQDALRLAAQSPTTTPGYGGLIKALASYAAGLPTQPIGGDPNAPLVVRVVRETATPQSRARDAAA